MLQTLAGSGLLSYRNDMNDFHDLLKDTTPVYQGNWTEDIASTEHVEFFKSVDWSTTNLGRAEQWSNALRLYVHQLLADSRPAIIYWYVL